MPGTTRDWIESWISIEGIPLRLIDTAGLRTTEDPVERAGVDRSRGILDEADIILYVIDACEGLDGEDRSFIDTERGIPLIPVWNKVDRSLLAFPEPYRDRGPISVSAVKGTGIEALASRIVAELELSTRGMDGDRAF
ncbi:hypothetical protein MASR2M78_09570 [Treponema sp.]